MSKTLTKKLIYIIAALAMLAMMIPAIPVSAQGSGTLAMYLLNPTGTNPAAPSTSGLTLDSGFNITGSRIRVVPTAFTGAATAVTAWSLTNYQQPLPGHADATMTANMTGGIGTAFADVLSGYGPFTVTATLSDGSTIFVDKKTTQIASTTLDVPSDVVLIWDEGSKTFYTTPITATDTVWGNFYNKDGAEPGNPLPVQGVILHWYLVAGNVSVPMTPGFFSVINPIISDLPRANFATFGMDGTSQVTVSGANGSSDLDLTADGEEPVYVVVVPEYPNLGNVLVTPEVASVNFWTSEMEKVPQVRWAGEKIVLEKYFGPAYAGALVRFSLENQSPGSLEGLQGTQLGNLNNTSQSVWDVVSTGTDAGWARCMLVSEDEGEVDVDLALYNQYGVTFTPTVDLATADVIQKHYAGDPIDESMTTGSVLNQHGFVVFYLKLESISLSNVVGKRDGHNTGLWTLPSNPWDVSLDTPLSQNATLNVSQDDLLRARVTGWFMGDNMSSRPARVQDADPNTKDVNGNPVYTYTLPAGRWILPNDWPILAGPNWQEMRLHWDIMDNPFDTVGSPVPTQDSAGLGAYVDPYTLGPSVADYPVIGPFRPGLEVPTATGYDPGISPALAFYDDTLPGFAQKTVVPNGTLDWWDAPMPPAKITFEITNGVGYFKDASKTDIYYVMVGTTKVYTNPFYQEMIPAFRWIPATVNNGGYDWNSWMVQYGPYPFWKIVNRLAGTVASTNVAQYPTKVQVYSDNHGEAMVWLNGNWNLPFLGNNGGADVIFGSTVGSTTVKAIADYPYFRKHNQLVSNTVTKNWTWGGQVIGPENAANNLAPMVLVAGSDSPQASDYIHLTAGANYTDPTAQGWSNKHVVWIWATDRDGMQAGVIGTQVDWKLSGSNAALYQGPAFTGINPNPNSNALQFDGNGFLLNAAHPGIVTLANRSTGTSWLRAPTAPEIAIFAKFWPLLNANDFAVAAIDIVTAGSATVTVNENLSGSDYAYTDINGVYHPIGLIMRETDFVPTNSYPLDDEIMLGDANLDGAVNVLDITAVERIILGMNQTRCAQADANYNNVIDMGDAVRIEKMFLGLK